MLIFAIGAVLIWGWIVIGWCLIAFEKFIHLFPPRFETPVTILLLASIMGAIFMAVYF